MKTTTSTWSLWLGISSYLFGDLTFGLLSLAAIITAIIAIKNQEHLYSVKAYWGLGLGIISLLLVIFL